MFKTYRDKMKFIMSSVLVSLGSLIFIFQGCGGTHVGDAANKPVKRLQLKFTGYSTNLLDFQFCVRTFMASAKDVNVDPATTELTSYLAGDHTYYRQTLNTDMDFFVDYGNWWWKVRWYLEGYPTTSRTVVITDIPRNDQLLEVPKAVYELIYLYSTGTTVQTYYARPVSTDCVVNGVTGDTLSITNLNGTFSTNGNIAISSYDIVALDGAAAESASVLFDVSAFAAEAKDVTSDLELETLLRNKSMLY